MYICRCILNTPRCDRLIGISDFHSQIEEELVNPEQL